MVFKLGKVTVPRSMGGERATVDVTIEGMTADGFAVISLAERDSTDYRGQMDFFVTCGVDKITITSEEKELQADTDLYYFACDNEIDGALLGDGSVDTDQIADEAVNVDKLIQELQPSHVVKFAGTATADDSTGTLAITVTGALETDVANVVLRSATADVYVKKAVLTADTLTVTLSGAGGVDTKIDYVIFRSAEVI